MSGVTCDNKSLVLVVVVYLFIFFAGYAYINMHTPMNVPVTVITKIVL